MLRQTLGQALKWGLVTRNVAQLAVPPRAVKEPVSQLTPEQVRRFLDATRDDRLGPLYHVAIATGLRQGELLGLRWQDLNLDAGTLTVRHALQMRDGAPEIVEPKTDKSRRSLALPASAVKALRSQRVQQAKDRLAAGARWQGDQWNLVFASTVGKPLNASNVTHRFQETIKRVSDASIERAYRAASGIPESEPLSEVQARDLAAIQSNPRQPLHQAHGLSRQRFHDLRHWCASLLLAQNVPARVVMEQLGHSQISLTMNTYSHVMPSALKEAAADALEAALA